MGVVYVARQTDLDRHVALKELGSFHAADATFAERFVRESRVAGSLNHPNVVTVYEYFEHDGTPYIAMEYIDSGSLRPWVGRLSTAQTAGVFEGVLAGLAHAAKHGIVHRDLKPENLLVTEEGTIKIGDFGIAKGLNQATVGRLLTATGTTVGTPTYMAPEQAMGREIGPWTDLYAVGVMAYEILVGRVPYDDADTPMVILMRHVNEAIPAPRSVNPDLDPELAAWIERLLVKAPEDRIRSAHQAWDELEEIVIGILGPRWRREARLLELVAPGAVTAEQPLTPAEFDPDSEDFQTVESAPTPARAEPEPAPPLLPPTVPPDRVVPAGGVTSFEWPAQGRPAGRKLWIGLAAAIAVLAAIGGGLAFVVGGGDEGAAAQTASTTPTLPPTTTEKPKPRPKPPPPPPVPTARSSSLRETATSVIATIRFRGARLGRKSLAVRDPNLTDGSGSVLIAQRGLKSVIGANEAAGIAFRPAAARNRLTIALAAGKGKFQSVEARPNAARTAVAIIATKTPPPRPIPRPDPIRDPIPDPIPDPVCRDKLGRQIPCR